MTPKQIENLKPGSETDAAIEKEFFGEEARSLDGDDVYFYVFQSNGNRRLPRQFSTRIEEALKILEASPGWRAWHTPEGINVQLIVKDPERRDGVDFITGIGCDNSLALAVCKAALMIRYYIEKWKHDTPIKVEWPPAVSVNPKEDSKA